jgi:methionyl-tRNA formyltransferase
MRVILLASRNQGILTLKALLERRDIVEVVGVVSGDEEFLKFATSMNQNVLKTEDVNSESFISNIKQLQAELLINVIFLQRYRSKLLGVPKFGAINVHPSLLPFYRGRDCIRWAMINGEKTVGVTVHQMDEGLDTGEILLQESFPIESEDTFLEVRDRMTSYYPKVVLRTVEILSKGREGLIRKKQDPRKEGTYFPHITQEDTRIKWSDSSRDIHNLIRACYEPGFYAHTSFKGKKLYVTKSRLRLGSNYQGLRYGSGLRLGRALDYDYEDDGESSLLIGTGDGVISVERCTFDQAIESKRAREILRRGDKLD